MRKKFVAVYRYKVEGENMKKLLDVADKATPLYKKYGWGGESATFIRREPNGVIGVLYLEYYRDKVNYERVMKATSADIKVLKLREEFDKLISPGTLAEEFFEVLN